jgi:UDP-glucose:(heptosyl)LPS alpha-1,3-glucosyltransferase
MRIALIRSRYNPYGGAERFVARAISALQKKGAAVTLIAREWRDDSASQDGVTFRRCNPFYLGKVWREHSFAQGVRRILEQEKFDLVQSHERIAGCDIYRAGDGVHAEWLRQRARVQNAAERMAVALSPYHRYVLAAERRMFEHPRLRAVICNSAMVRDEIRARFNIEADKLHVIYNGVDTGWFHPCLAATHRTAVRDQLHIPHEAPLFLFVGSGFERKGVAVLIEALLKIQGAYALVVGADKQLARYRAIASPRVLFLGGQSDVRPYYGAADAFVLPTLYDPQPNAALEALACGLPLVTSSKCGAAELVKEGVSGFVRDALDVAGFAEAMRSSIDPSRNPALRLAAREVAEPLTLDAMASRLLALYGSLA